MAHIDDNPLKDDPMYINSTQLIVSRQGLAELTSNCWMDIVKNFNSTSAN